MKRQIYCLILVLITTSSAFAGRTWYYNEVTNSQGMPIGYGDSAIAMRSNNAWPVVAYSSGSSNSGVASMVPGAWAKGPASFNGYYLDGATAPDGTVGFVDNTGQAVMLTKTGGWGSSYYGSPPMGPYKSSIAFNNNSAPGVLYRSTSGSLTLSMKSGGAWYSSSVRETGGPEIQTNAYALDFDSYNQANVAFTEGGYLRYATKGVLTGNQWVMNSFMDAPEIGNASQIDMALTNEDVPYVLYSSLENGPILKYATYDRQSDSWTTNILDMLTTSGPPTNFCVTTDSAGGIGVAYVANFAGKSMLSYAYNDGSGWMGLDRLTEVRGEWMVGLAYDYENNPVISYVDQAGNLSIAYDPQIPEPATMAMLALGLAFIRRRK